ncbi:hypothetical protein DENIS_0726 [Desulfonema ishimotonii]|uniref:Uncharacterized protein n=2 Tax=Desulfonema ishimotonii TaxID=45657 RepID=A0A401FS45_9BACT|nr:hypothetical protein DENIS_0726 [Desulfonema ishimotonii]
MYRSAVADARVAEADEIYGELTAITHDNTDLIWDDGKKRVLVVTWTSWAGYDDKIGQQMEMSRETWVTVVPELKDFCGKPETSEIPLRLEQLLGLPPGNGKNRFAELWVSPHDLFRPSPDPEITDRESELSFPPGAGYEHKKWISDLANRSYDENGYPWTRLGYTYDWGNPADEVGLSEFVIRKGAFVEVRSVSENAAYCK